MIDHNGPLGSPVLTASEACRFLRLLDDQADALADPDAAAAAVETLNRFVRQRRLRPIRGTRPRLYALEELARFVRDETLAFGPLKAADADGDMEAP